MLDPFDYKEPSCALYGGDEFYYPDPNSPKGNIPVSRIIGKIDSCFEKNDVAEARRLLEYWCAEAKQLNDLQGQLAMLSELIGLYRKTLEQEKAILAIDDALKLCEELKVSDTVSGATVILNCATTLKAFGKAKEAMPLYEETLAVYNSKLSTGDSRFGGLYNNMALALVDLKEYDRAYAYFTNALKIMGDTGNKLECAITYVNMAQSFYGIKEQGELEEYIKNAITLLFDSSNEQNGYYAFVCSKCSPTIREFGYVSEGEKLDRLVQEIYERA